MAILLGFGAVTVGGQELAGPMVSTSPYAVSDDAGLGEGEGADLSVNVSTETPKPDWLIRAERTFAEGAAAEAAGDARTARRRYARALKIFADGADDATLLDLRPEIAELLSLAPDVPFARPCEEEPKTEVRPVTVQEFKAAGAPAGVGTSTKTYALPIHPDDPLVKRYVTLYSGALRDRTQAAIDRMAQHQKMILTALSDEGLPSELLYLPVIESEYQPFAVSRAGAVGMWQFMPTTAKYAGLKVNYWIDERRDPVKSTHAALKTLKSLYDWFDDWHLALAAYNRGMYGIQRDLEFTRSTDFNLLSKRQGLPTETEHYVPKLMAVVVIAQNYKAYGFRPPDPTRRPRPDEVVLERPLDLKVAAGAAQTTEDVIRELNPSVRLWCTPQNEAQFLFRIPAGSKERFLAELAKVKDWTPSPGFVKYKVQKGDILGRIAQRYRTTAAAIQRDNKISDPRRVRPGQVLVIRPGRGFKGD